MSEVLRLTQENQVLHTRLEESEKARSMNADLFVASQNKLHDAWDKLEALREKHARLRKAAEAFFSACSDREKRHLEKEAADLRAALAEECVHDYQPAEKEGPPWCRKCGAVLLVRRKSDS